jgi:hypothetical protein
MIAKADGPYYTKAMRANHEIKEGLASVQVKQEANAPYLDE